MSNLRNTVVLAVATAVVLGALEWQSRADAPRKTKAAATKAEQSSIKPNDKPKQKKPLLSKYMRAKLTASTQVLEGLCTENYDLVVKGAKALEKLSSGEKWRVSNDAMYRQHSAEFRRAVGDLRKAGENKKLDSAALAWTKTTLSCIDCHRCLKTILISDRPRKGKRR